MWKRFIRAIKALFGGAVSAIEDPKLILEQNIRELNEQVPKMNESIATVRANVTLLEREMAKYKKEYTDIVSKMKAAIKAGRDDIAANYAVRLETLKSHMSQTQGQLDTAKKAYEKAIEVKKAFMREKDRKIAEAKEALRAHERAKYQEKIANTMASFETYGINDTHDEMVNKINEKTATMEAKMEIALDSVDTESLKIEEEAEKLRAEELVKQFKMEMGMGETNSTDDISTSEDINIENKDKTE